MGAESIESAAQRKQKEYEVFLPEDVNLEEGKEIELELKDRETYEKFTAVVIVSKTRERLEEPVDLLFVRRGSRLTSGGAEGFISPVSTADWDFKVEEKPLYVKILERKEEKVEAKVLPKRWISYRERRGYMIRSMLEERLGKTEEKQTESEGNRYEAH